jgi:hypothetical protein
MEVVIEVCDICGKKHGIMLKREDVIFGDRRCFLDFCNSIWLRWEREEFEARGVIAKKDKDVQPVKEDLEEVENRIVRESALVFNPRKVAG